MTLAEQECVPCEGGVEALSPEQAQEKLADLPGWELIESATKLHKKYEFKNFKQALSFTNAIGDIAEAENHHPDLKLGWGYVDVVMQTHSIGGLHANDFIIAARIEAANP